VALSLARGPGSDRPLLGAVAVPGADGPDLSLHEPLAAALRSSVSDPTVVVVEDVHELDPALIRALGEAVDLLDSTPILVVATVRVDALGRDLDASGIADVLRRSGGNAFFAEELLLANHASLSWTVTHTVLDRVQTVAPASQRVAEVLAIGGGSLARGVVEASSPKVRKGSSRCSPPASPSRSIVSTCPGGPIAASCAPGPPPSSVTWP
jgi:hypothetical protein